MGGKLSKDFFMIYPWVCQKPRMVPGEEQVKIPTEQGKFFFTCDAVTLLENFLQKCSMGYILYPWISLLEPTLETSYKPQT